MRRLAVEIILEAQRLPVEAVLLVADLLHRAAHGGLDLVECARRPGAILINALAADLARQHDELGRGQRFARDACRSEEHTSELQSLMRISYAVFCLKKKKNNLSNHKIHT